jgi:hypothetical protein
VTDSQAAAVEKPGEIGAKERDTPPAPLPDIERRRVQACERKRRQRERQKLGAIIVPVCVFEDDLDAALQRGEISEEEIDDRDLLSTFLEGDLSHRLRKGSPI